jgi:ADP-ribose pyrophosphatase
MSDDDNAQRPSDWQILERERVYNGFFRVDRYRLRHALFAGGQSGPIVRELLDRGDAVVVLPYDPLRDQVVVLEQFRIGAMALPQGPWLLEFVAGMIEQGESAEEVARREAMEEAGMTMGRLEPVCDFFVSPGGTSERVFVFCGEVDSSTAHGLHGIAAEGEDIRLHVVSFGQAWQWLQKRRINTAGPVIALQWLKLNRHWLRRRWCGEPKAKG